MKKIIEDNYKSIVKRGLITKYTTHYEFHAKLEEEVSELDCADGMDEITEELADVILVCLNWAKHYEIDIEKALKDKIKVNFKRAENGRK